jgi:medium-chain acyl-[acyl-carrier-protein] hydrolase
MFRTWPDDLPPDIEVCPVQLPGRESRLKEPPFTRLKHLVQTLVPLLCPYLSIPFAFFGHSMGALISFELARQLRRRSGLSPVHLFVSGRPAPPIPAPDPPIHELPESAFVEELRRLNGTPESVLQNPELMQLVLPILRADFALSETFVYSTEDPLDCPISAFGGLQDGEVSHNDLAAWREQTHSSFTLRIFPGNHFFLQSARALILSAVSQELTRHLRRITGGQRS